MYTLKAEPNIITEEPNISQLEVLPKLGSLEKLKELIKENQEYNNTTLRDDNFSEVTQSINKNEMSKDSHSTTNVQVAGVDEADIVKTDGRYIYYIANKKVVIIDAESPSNLKIVSEIKDMYSNSENFNPQELYISENKLIVIGNYFVYNENLNSNSSSFDMINIRDKRYTVAMLRYYKYGKY